MNVLLVALVVPPVVAVPALGRWSSTGPLATPLLYEHSATLLRTGKVLVVAGFDAKSTQLYDPVKNRWDRTGPLSRPPNAHTATLLADGKVLVVSGAFQIDEAGFAEVYDPRSETWAPVGSVRVGRSHTATALQDGKVLAVGGIVGGTVENPGHSVLTSAELYDPAKKEWTATGPIGMGRADHSAVPLADGKVLVAGGRGEELGFSLNVAEIYDPATGNWQLAPSVMKNGRAKSTATLTPDGRVLVVGGTLLIEGTGRTKELLGRRAVMSATELYDPRKGQWLQSANLGEARRSHAATALPGGQLLVTGGADDSEDPSGRSFISSAELYDPGNRTWQAARRMPVTPLVHTATALVKKPCGSNCGKVLVVGRTDAEGSAHLFTAPKDLDEDAGNGRALGSVPLAALAVFLVVLLLIVAAARRRSR